MTSGFPGHAPEAGTVGSLLRALPLATTSVDGLDALFKGFADPTRLRILNMLAAGELCVCDLVELLVLPQPTVSRHLAYLRRTGLVTMTREWKFAHYRLAEPSHPVHATMLACVHSCFVGIPSLDAERVHAASRVTARATEASDACR
jgi:ArsR family transcriptional regulator, arsenate/arsenite/antimonite-responsive transcriptional repressor